jgi:IPT/TIG domain
MKFPDLGSFRGLLFTSLAVPALLAQNNILTFHNDNMRTGQNLAETTLTPANVSVSKFGKLFSVAMDGKVDAEPLLVSSLNMPGVGSRNVAFSATEHDSLYAFDADKGTLYWQISLLKSGETSSDSRGCNQVVPEIGVTSTPVIDLTAGPHGTIYVVAMSKNSTGSYFQRLHAIDITTGAEQFGGPVDIAATYPGTGDNSGNGSVVFDPKQYKARPALLISNGIVYTSWGSHCDLRPYTGWTLGYDRLTLAQKSVLNFAPNGEGAAIWAGSGGGVSADSSGNLFFITANGTFDTVLNGSGFPSQGDFGNSFVRISPSGNALVVADYWSMFNSVSESSADEDLGSGGILLLPDLADSTGTTRHLGVGAGKDRNLYLFDRDNMGKFDAVNNGTLYQEVPNALSGSEFSTPAWFNGTLYFGGVGDVLRAFKVTAAMLGSTATSASATTFAFPGTTPSVSANGLTNGIVWAVENSSNAVLHAYDATDLVTELYNSNQAAGGRDNFGAGNKFMTPAVGNGKVYVGTPNGVAVFGELRATVTSVAPPTGAQGTSVNITLDGSNFVPGAVVNVTGTGVMSSNVVVVTASEITATLTINAGAATGSYSLSVTGPNGTSNTVPFTVTAGGQTPTVTSVNPPGGSQGSNVNVVIAGTNFSATSSVKVSGLGVTIGSLAVISSVQIDATFKIGALAPASLRSVTVTTAAGTSNGLPFTVSAGVEPTLTSITPNHGTQGTVNVTLAGANFTAGAKIHFAGIGITITNVVVVSATEITATIHLSRFVATGAHNVEVETAAGSSNTLPFTVD